MSEELILQTFIHPICCRSGQLSYRVVRGLQKNITAWNERAGSLQAFLDRDETSPVADV